MFGFHLLICQTFIYRPCNLSLCVTALEELPQISIHFYSSAVHRVQSIISFSKIFLFNSSLLGTHNLFWNLKLPSSCIMKLGNFHCAILHVRCFSLASSFWLALISFIMRGYTSNADNSPSIDPGNRSSIPMVLRSIRMSGWVFIIMFNSCWVFLLSAFATSFAFPRWYWIFIL